MARLPTLATSRVRLLGQSVDLLNFLKIVRITNCGIMQIYRLESGDTLNKGFKIPFPGLVFVQSKRRNHFAKSSKVKKVTRFLLAGAQAVRGCVSGFALDL